MRGRWKLKPVWAPPESIAYLNAAFGWKVALDAKMEVTFGEKGVYVRDYASRGCDFREYPSCEIVECVLCKKILRKAWATPVYLCTPMDYEERRFEDFHGDACFGCVGRVNAISRKLREFYQIKSLIAKLERSRLNAAKTQNDRRSSRVPAQGDRGSGCGPNGFGAGGFDNQVGGPDQRIAIG